MLSKIISASVTGIDAFIVSVEVDCSNGLPGFTMTGYLGAQVREAGDRVRTAIKNVGYKMPSYKIVVNVSPASIRKSGSMFDLPVALGILCDMGIVHSSKLKDILVVGELSLDGKVNQIAGILPIVAKAKESGIRKCIIPGDNRREASLIEDMEIIHVDNLTQAITAVNENLCGTTAKKLEFNLENQDIGEDFASIAGQAMAKRAAVIAAAGRHNLLLAGPPGGGKTLISNRIPYIMPPLTPNEVIDISKIYSVAGMLNEERGYVSQRPFRAPHHTISKSALLGGGSNPKPGEITLAHKGVLFLDELTKFSESTLECLRQPIEDGSVSISRSFGTVNYPSDFILVAAMNPCKCGFYPDRNKCNCTDSDIKRHIGKLSKPFLDRFDLAVHVDKPEYNQLSGKNRENMSSKEMREIVKKAITIQQKRYKGTNIEYNSKLSFKQLKEYCPLDEACSNLMEKAYDKYDLSARGYVKIIKVARTIADIEGSKDINSGHLSEAICFRNINIQ